MLVEDVNSFSSSLPRRNTLLSSQARLEKTALCYGPEHSQEEGVYENLVFQSPVLQNVYPALLSYKERYGHPNIPLGTKEGRQCDSLRRLHIQNKLAPEEVSWLEALGFRFHSLEDVYRYANFDDLFGRLVKYEQENKTNYQVPKKYPEDPELGAWVTGIRRLGKEGVNPEHERRLDSIGFAWISTRKCGSKFMQKFRELQNDIAERGFEKVMEEPETISWIRAQQEALKRGTLSQTRVHYMGDVFGESWTTIK